MCFLPQNILPYYFEYYPFLFSLFKIYVLDCQTVMLFRGCFVSLRNVLFCILKCFCLAMYNVLCLLKESNGVNVFVMIIYVVGALLGTICDWNWDICVMMEYIALFYLCLLGCFCFCKCKINVKQQAMYATSEMYQLDKQFKNIKK